MADITNAELKQKLYTFPFVCYYHVQQLFTQ